MKTTYYLTKDQTLLECVVVKETATSRRLQLLEGPTPGAEVLAHPMGVAWGHQYPRVFHVAGRPAGVFAFRGRALLVHPSAADHPAIPAENPHYRFQPFLRDVIDAVHAAEPVLLTGGTGVGKTTHIEQLASRIRQPLLRINFNGETRMSDLIGKLAVVNGETRWVDGVIPTAMRQGWWLLLDEIDFADPAVLSLLHPVLEDRPTLTLKENAGEVVVAHPEFRIFATSNSIGAMQDRAGAYAGTSTMNDAFLDRWQVLLVENLPEKEEIKVLRGAVPGLKPEWAKGIVRFAIRVRDQQRQGGGDGSFGGDNFSTRKVLAWGRKAALHRSPIIGAQKAWLDKLPAAERGVVQRLLDTQFGVRAKRKRKANRGIGTAVKRSRASRAREAPAGDPLTIAA